HDELEKEYDKYRNHEKQLMSEAKDKANQRVKAATKEADEIIKELRELRDKKGADVKEHELINKKKQLDDQYEAKALKQKAEHKKWDEIKVGDDGKVIIYVEKDEIREIQEDN